MDTSHSTCVRTAIVVVLSVILSPREMFAAPTVFFESPTTLVDKNGNHSEILARELPRQALLLTASREMGWNCIDSTLEPSTEPGERDWRLVVQRFGSDKLDPIHLELREQGTTGASTQPAVLDVVDLHPRILPIEAVDYADLNAQSSALVKTKWAPMVAKLRSAAMNPLKWNPSLAAPEACDELLQDVDPLHAFLAARLAHASIAQHGESPELLGVLVRSYAHLGDATRFLFTAQSSAFFARSLIFAQRYVDAAPNDPNAYWHRAYALALLGQPRQAEEDLKRAADLAMDAQAKAPQWIELMRDRLAFRTEVLASKANDPRFGSLAAYFSWLTIEHCALYHTTIRAGRIVTEKNPYAFRVWDSLSRYGGIGARGQACNEAPAKLNALLAELSTDPIIPPAIALAASTASEAKFSADATLALLSAMEAQPAEVGQPLQWSTLASILRETQFAQSFRTLDFFTNTIGAPVDGQLARDWPMLKSHRYATLLASFDKSGRITGEAGSIDRVRALAMHDDSLNCSAIFKHLNQLNVRTDPTFGLPIEVRQLYQSDQTTFDDSRALWARQSFVRGSPDRAWRLPVEAGLLAASPDDPVGLSFALMDGGPGSDALLQRAEREMGDHPVVAWAVGGAHAKRGHDEQAVKFLEFAARSDTNVYLLETLANLYLKKGDEEMWLKTWERFFSEGEDTGLEGATVASSIAKRFLDTDRPERALPWSERAATSGAGWAMQYLGDNYMQLGRYDEAIEQYRTVATSYNSPYAWFFAATALNHPSVKDAAAACVDYFRMLERRGAPEHFQVIGTYYYLRGDLKLSLATWKRARATNNDGLAASLVALQLKETGPADEAKAYLDEFVASSAAPPTTMPTTSPTTSPTTKSVSQEELFHECAVLLVKLFNDPHATISSDEVNQILPAPGGDNDARRAGALYVIGRGCELSGHPDDAKTYYRQAIAASRRSGSRVLPAVALRKLGEDYFAPKK